MFRGLFGSSSADTNATLNAQAARTAATESAANGRAAARAVRSQRSVGGSSTTSTPHGSTQQRAYNPRGRS